MKKVAGLLNPGDLLTKNICIERIDTYPDIIGYVFSEGRGSATSKLNAISGHRAARGIFRDSQTPGQMLTSGTPDVSVRGELPAASQGEIRQEAKHWFQLSQLHLRGASGTRALISLRVARGSAGETSPA